MSEYKTLDEYFPNGKPDGKKFTPIKDWITFEPFFQAKNGLWYGKDNIGDARAYSHSDLFKEYIPPKQTKKVKMYKPVFKDTTGQYCANIHYEWDSIKPDNLEHLAGYLEMEVEVEE